MADFGMAAFSMFFMQSESFLDFQRQLEEGQGTSNCQTLFGMEKIPSDNHIRSMLDPVPPEHFYPLFGSALEVLAQNKGLDNFQCLEKNTLIALDGTEYFNSYEIHCPRCSTRKRGKKQKSKDEKLEYFHTMLSATIVASGRNQVIPPSYSPAVQKKVGAPQKLL